MSVLSFYYYCHFFKVVHITVQLKIRVFLKAYPISREEEEKKKERRREVQGSNPRNWSQGNLKSGLVRGRARPPARCDQRRAPPDPRGPAARPSSSRGSSLGFQVEWGLLKFVGAGGLEHSARDPRMGSVL